MKLPDYKYLKQELPQTFWGKMLGATPIVMTVIATLMAGLSNSEMTRAQYDRSLAAQQQSKVADQWSFFQAKRQRGASLVATYRLLQATADLGRLDPEILRRVAGASITPAILDKAIAQLTTGEGIGLNPKLGLDPKIKESLEAVANGQPEANVMEVLKFVPVKDLQLAVRAAQDEARLADSAGNPVADAVNQLERLIMDSSGMEKEARKSLMRDFTAARMRFDAVRYDGEARFNRSVAELMELQVKQSNSSAERHRVRSQRFFFGMLGAQMAVILASFALAVTHKNLLWIFASVIGVAALGFGVYVYLYL